MTTPALPFDGCSPFDVLMHRDGGTEWWSARDLMPHLEYTDWRNFEKVVLKVREGLEHVSAGRDMVVETNRHVERGFGGTQEIRDYRLTRGAVYMVALECDGSKPSVAAVKRYFAAGADLPLTVRAITGTVH